MLFLYLTNSSDFQAFFPMLISIHWFAIFFSSIILGSSKLRILRSYFLISLNFSEFFVFFDPEPFIFPKISDFAGPDYFFLKSPVFHCVRVTSDSIFLQKFTKKSFRRLRVIYRSFQVRNPSFDLRSEGLDLERNGHTA